MMIHILLLAALAAPDTVKIAIDFPGGNVTIKKIEGDTVHLEPDLRGGRTWFYWSFEATSATARTVRFVLPEKRSMKYISMQGPAVSLDGGKTWNWLGADSVEGPAFSYAFKPKKTVRFCVTIPYFQSDLDRFLKRNAKNRHLKKSILTKTRKGRPVELLEIGAPGKGRKTVMMTARHHACETMASFLLEGFLQEAISESPDGKAFRAKYHLFVVPIVDKDGVQDGDQGKNRNPHDHNRDYIEKPLFPSVKAIMELAKAKTFHYAMDWHCPTLWMDYHQVIYFPGPKDIPKNNYENVKHFAGVLKKELPPEAPRGCLVMLKSGRQGSHFSDHFSRKESMIMAMTLEFPYASPKKKMDPASCVKYGASVLRAWNKSQFKED